MSNFITVGPATLPVVKTDARQPSGATSEWTAEDANMIRQALLDIRNQILLTNPGTFQGQPVTVTGDPANNTALLSLIAALVSLGFVTDATSVKYETDKIVVLASDSYASAVQ